MEYNSDHTRANSNMDSNGLANQITGETPYVPYTELSTSNSLDLLADLEDFPNNLLNFSENFSPTDTNLTRSYETNKSNESIQIK